MSKVCQCKNGNYSKDCCDDYLAQGIGSLENQGTFVTTSKNTLKTSVTVVNGTEIGI